MIFFHHDFRIELDDTWWQAAGMESFVRKGQSFRVDVSQARGRAISIVAIKDIAPMRRNLSHGVFNNNETGSAQQRVTSILTGFRTNAALPPVEVVEQPPGSAQRYKLTAGVHRLYCSVAVGYTHLPCVEGFDIATLDQ